MPSIVRSQSVDIDSIQGYPGNARRGDLGLLKESLSENGQYRPIVVQHRTGYILAGNHTWQAAKELGWTTIEITLVEATEAEARKIVLVDNRGNDIAGYDETALAKLLKDLDGDFTGTGFDNTDLTKMMDALAKSEANESEDDEIDPDKVETRVSTDDVWVLGDHRLVCGSSVELGTLGLLMGPEKARLVVTSPPYNQKLDSFKPSGMQKEAPNWINRMASSYSDSLPEPEYQDEQVQVLNNLATIMTDDGSVFYNHKIRYREKRVLTPYEWLTRADVPFAIRQEIIWQRKVSITLNARMFMPCDERIYWLTKGEKFLFNDTPEIKAFSSVWHIHPRVEKSVSAPFPLELPSRCIQACSARGDIVVDPYGGSGTTLMACEELGRRGYLSEINPAYCDVIIARWEEATGRTAYLEGEN